jgi:hypothetical protein
MDASPVAVEGRSAVVRLEVRYGDPVHQKYRDLWLLRLGRRGSTSSPRSSGRTTSPSPAAGSWTRWWSEGRPHAAPRRRHARQTPAGVSTYADVADQEQLSLQEQLDGIGAQLDWVVVTCDPDRLGNGRSSSRPSSGSPDSGTTSSAPPPSARSTLAWRSVSTATNGSRASTRTPRSCSSSTKPRGRRRTEHRPAAAGARAPAGGRALLRRVRQRRRRRVDPG